MYQDQERRAKSSRTARESSDRDGNSLCLTLPPAMCINTHVEAADLPGPRVEQFSHQILDKKDDNKRKDLSLNTSPTIFEYDLTSTVLLRIG